MLTLAIDIGTSSVKAAVLRDTQIVGDIAWVKNSPTTSGDRVEHDPDATLDALASAIKQLGDIARTVDVIAPAFMSPAWVAIDYDGNALTPIVGHQDRRSVEQANQIEARVGRERHLQLVGNRPVQGSISSTTLLWFSTHHPEVVRRAETFAHVQTLLHLAWANARVCDPSNASFTGFYHTTTLGGWSDELLAACDTDSSRMPRVLDANHVAGHISDQGASRFHLRQGTPVLVGCMDTSAAMLMGSSSGSVASGQLINVAGTTDVLGLAVDECRVDERVLTRALGVGRKWMSVATIATAGAAIEWALRELFPEDVDRNAVLNQLDFSRPLPEVDINFAGSRTSIEQTFGEIRGVKLSTTRHDILAGIVIALARAGSRRFELLRQINPVDFSPTVLVSGGYATDMGDAIDRVLYKDWPARLTRLHVDHATLRGLGMLAAAADL